MDSNDQTQEPHSEGPPPEGASSESAQGERPRREGGGRGRSRRRGGRGRSRRQGGGRDAQAEGQADGDSQQLEQADVAEPVDAAEEPRQERPEGQSQERGEGRRQGQRPRGQRQGGRDGGRERGRGGGREGGREGARDGARDAGREGERAGGREGGRDGGRDRGQRGRGGRQQGERQPSPKASKVALIAPATPAASAWADRIEQHLQKHARTVTRQNVEGNAGLTERLKEARAHGAHRIVALGDHQFVRWAAQAMVGSLMPLAPVLLPGSQPIFGYQPLPTSGWEPMVESLLSHRFAKVDMAMGTVNPFVHQLLAGFPASNGTAKTSTFQAIFNNSSLKLKIQVDRTAVEGDFWCLAVANADLPAGSVRWLPGSNWEDQRLDLLLVRPRSMWQKWKFMQALKRGEHGAEPGVLRYRGHRITVHAEQPWRYSADGSQTQEAASPMVMEARPQMLRLVVPEG